MSKNIRTRTYQERLLSWLIWKLDTRLERLSEQAWAAHEEAYYAQNFVGPVVQKPVLISEGWCGCCQPDCTRGCGEDFEKRPCPELGICLCESGGNCAYDKTCC
jgi:hypothetical protein